MIKFSSNYFNLQKEYLFIFVIGVYISLSYIVLSLKIPAFWFILLCNAVLILILVQQIKILSNFLRLKWWKLPNREWICIDGKKMLKCCFETRVTFNSSWAVGEQLKKKKNEYNQKTSKQKYTIHIHFFYSMTDRPTDKLNNLLDAHWYLMIFNKNYSCLAWIASAKFLFPSFRLL